ncbi:MAG: DUF4040 domain-containing protein [Elusimicrobia bacterium]|nr:DUF4040 domain-containing protein [Elusimicrobiota bacterium]
MLELQILLVLMIIGAIAAIEMKDLLSAVVAVGAVGLGLSLAFLILKAPDLAMVQLVVEILALIFMIRATIKRDIIQTEKSPKFLVVFTSLAFIAVFMVFAYFCLENLPVFGSPTMAVSKHYISEGLSSTGVTNLVSSVILDFRAYDTLGEATVLFTAVIGALAVLRKIGRKKGE